MSLQHVLYGSSSPQIPLSGIFGLQNVTPTTSSSTSITAPYAIINGNGTSLTIIQSGAMVLNGSHCVIRNDSTSALTMTLNTGVFKVSNSTASTGSCIIGAGTSQASVYQSGVSYLL